MKVIPRSGSSFRATNLPVHGSSTNRRCSAPRFIRKRHRSWMTGQTSSSMICFQWSITLVIKAASLNAILELTDSSTFGKSWLISPSERIIKKTTSHEPAGFSLMKRNGILLWNLIPLWWRGTTCLYWMQNIIDTAIRKMPPTFHSLPPSTSRLPTVST